MCFFVGLLLLFCHVQPLFLAWIGFVITLKAFGYHFKSPQSSFGLASQHLRQRHQFLPRHPLREETCLFPQQGTLAMVAISGLHETYYWELSFISWVSLLISTFLGWTHLLRFNFLGSQFSTQAQVHPPQIVSQNFII